MYTNDNFETVNEDGSITITNKGAFVASCSLSYRYNGKLIEQSSPYLYVLQSFKFKIPKESTDIRFLAIMWLDLEDWESIFRYESSTPQKKCFYLWGTVFYAGGTEIPCPGDDGNGPDDPTPPCCCCCCCCCHH